MYSLHRATAAPSVVCFALKVLPDVQIICRNVTVKGKGIISVPIGEENWSSGSCSRMRGPGATFSVRGLVRNAGPCTGEFTGAHCTQCSANLLWQIHGA